MNAEQTPSDKPNTNCVNQHSGKDRTQDKKEVANIMFFIILTLISGLVLYLIVCDAHNASSQQSQPAQNDSHQIMSLQ